jgi:hypothetical protein
MKLNRDGAVMSDEAGRTMDDDDERKRSGLLQRLQARGIEPSPPLDLTWVNRMIAAARPPLEAGPDGDTAPPPEATRNAPTKRKPPRLDPVKSAAKMIAKNPELVARIKPDGEIEIANKTTTPPAAQDDTEMDAGANDDVWRAIAAIKNEGKHGAH